MLLFILEMLEISAVQEQQKSLAYLVEFSLFSADVKFHAYCRKCEQPSWITRRARVPSTPQTLDRFLELLNAGSYQSDSVEEVLQTCDLIRAEKDTLSEDLFKVLRYQSGIKPKVLSKLLQIGVDDRLDALEDKLPPKYSTIHQIHCLTDKELKAAREEESCTQHSPS